MSRIDLNEPVARLVIEHPGVAEVFEQYGIDYCCGGQLPLSEACRAAGVAPEELVGRLEEVLSRKGDQPEENPAGLPPDQLCDHIVQRHHDYLREALPRLSELLRKSRDAHEAAHPELRDLEQVFAALRAELEQHMMKEEMVLFPAVKQLVAAARPPLFPFGTVRNPIAVMEDEHNHAADALRRMRELTGGYRPPEDACATYRELLRGLSELERDLHMHIHKENNLLFPAVIELEQKLATKPAS